MVTIEKQDKKKTELTVSRCFLKTDNSQLDYRAQTKLSYRSSLMGHPC